MHYISNILFALILFGGIWFFIKNIKKLIRNIKLGKKTGRNDKKNQRWANMFRIALGQSKMVNRPVSGILHIIVYLGFIVINIEVLEIIIDGLFGTHRVFKFLGRFYGFLIGTFEILAVLVFVSVVVFWIRRNIIKIKRFWSKEIKGWPKNDANYILYFELILMTLFLILNASDTSFQYMENGNIISRYIYEFLPHSKVTLHLIERVCWWLHIVGIIIFLNYLYYSKHLHILLAFPNTFYANLNLKGKFENDENVTREVKLMINPNEDLSEKPTQEEQIPKFGASDITDLSRVQLMNAYSCTECGRCTSVCPASQTGKELSPRLIMMKTRDRVEEIGKNIDKNGTFKDDGKHLLNDYITPEELWACTSCNACVEECPVNIDPLSIIMDMRKYLVLEESLAPKELNSMISNIENNGAPWQYNQMDRLNWRYQD